MKVRVFLILPITVMILGAQEGGVVEHEFSNTNGKKIRASVVGIEGKSVQLKVGDQVFPVPIVTLVEEDKAYLKQWLKDNPAYALRFAVYHREGPSPLGGGMAPNPGMGQPVLPRGLFTGNSITLGRSEKETVVTEDDYHYELLVINDSGIELKDVEVRYRVFVKRTRRGADAGVEIEQIGGLTRVPAFRVGPGNQVRTSTISLSGTRKETTSTDTVTVPIQGTFNSRSYDVTSTSRESERPEAAGIWFRIYHNGRLIEEYEDLHDDVARRKPTWEENVPMLIDLQMP